jgi:hypothetical protein
MYNLKFGGGKKSTKTSTKTKKTTKPKKTIKLPKIKKLPKKIEKDINTFISDVATFIKTSDKSVELRPLEMIAYLKEWRLNDLKILWNEFTSNNLYPTINPTYILYRANLEHSGGPTAQCKAVLPYKNYNAHTVAEIQAAAVAAAAACAVHSSLAAVQYQTAIFNADSVAPLPAAISSALPYNYPNSPALVAHLPQPADISYLWFSDIMRSNLKKSVNTDYNHYKISIIGVQHPPPPPPGTIIHYLHSILERNPSMNSQSFVVDQGGEKPYILYLDNCFDEYAQDRYMHTSGNLAPGSINQLSYKILARVQVSAIQQAPGINVLTSTHYPKCWLCGESVCSFVIYNDINGFEFTPCGDCEHVLGIAEAILYNTLYYGNADIRKIQVDEYDFSHVRCNRKKNGYFMLKWDKDNNICTLAPKRAQYVLTAIKNSSYEQDIEELRIYGHPCINLYSNMNMRVSQVETKLHKMVTEINEYEYSSIKANPQVNPYGIATILVISWLARKNIESIAPHLWRTNPEPVLTRFYGGSSYKILDKKSVHKDNENFKDNKVVIKHFDTTDKNIKYASSVYLPKNETNEHLYDCIYGFDPKIHPFSNPNLGLTIEVNPNRKKTKDSPNILNNNKIDDFLKILEYKYSKPISNISKLITSIPNSSKPISNISKLNSENNSKPISNISKLITSIPISSKTISNISKLITSRATSSKIINTKKSKRYIRG